MPLVGDWNGDGIDTVGVYRPGERRFFLFQSNSAASAILTPFAYGSAGDKPLIGDWRIDAAEPTVAQIANAYGFYVDPESNPAEWVAANPPDPRAATIRASIASRPMARWFGEWSGDVSAAVSSYVTTAFGLGPFGKVPVLVPSAVPGSDCTASTAAEEAAYRTWIDAFATALGNRPAVVVLEPGSLAGMECLPTDAARLARQELVRYAAAQLRQKSPRAWVYLDAGNPGWIAADTMAQWLDGVGLRTVRGFAVNTTNFYTTAESTTYATAIETALQTRYGYIARFVVDTSRNGNGAGTGEWCNPSGRRLGVPADVVEEPRPNSTPRSRMADLLLWVKTPGDSDGPCGTAPDTEAGEFDPGLAANLVTGT